MPVAVQLASRFDPVRLQQDLQRVTEYKFVKQRTFSAGTSHEGWGGISLRAIGGRWDDSSAGGPSLAGYEDTEVLKHTPYFKEVLDGLDCPKCSVRLSELVPGGEIKRHCDKTRNFQGGLLRLHIPIVTNEKVVFELGGENLHWRAGEFWYGDFTKEHYVRNDGDSTRVHMIIEVNITPFILKQFPADYVAQQRDIMMYDAPVELTATQLERYCCDFIGTGKLGSIPLHRGLPVERNVADGFAGSVRVVDGQLTILVDGRPTCVLEPVGEDRFRFRGRAEMRVKFSFTGDRVSGARLSLDADALELPLRTAMPVGV